MLKSKRIALLSHRFGNIGHLFMSVGFEEIIKQMFDGKAEIEHFEQHRFFSIYPEGHWLHWLDKVPHGRLSRLRMWLNSPEQCERFWQDASHLKQFGAAIACGGPSIVRGVGQTPEMNLMFHHQFGAFHAHGVPTFDCGVGSGGFPLNKLPASPAQAFDEMDKRYFERLFSYSTVSTVRDRYAQELWWALGRQAPLIPCGALVSGRRFQALAPRSDSNGENYIVINYQLTGANNDWGQKVDISKWRSTVADLIKRLQKRHKVVFLCHNKAEERHARMVGADIPYLTPTTLQEYAEIIMRGKAGVASRIHAAIPMAGVGLPVTAIGTDTRLGTLDLMGIHTHFVSDATSELLEHEIEAGIKNSDAERHRLLDLREATARQYIEVFAPFVSA